MSMLDKLSDGQVRTEMGLRRVRRKELARAHNTRRSAFRFRRDRDRRKFIGHDLSLLRMVREYF
jgi:hypothetical protein